MNYADRVKDITTTTGTGPITLAGTPPSGYQGLAAIGTTGATFVYGLSGGAEWEIGIGTITGTLTVARAPTASSNGGAVVNLSAGTKDFFCTLSAATIAKLASVGAAAFSTAIPLTVAGATYMPQQAVASVLAFTIAAAPVQGALCYLRLIADGTNAPTFAGMKEWGGSLGYDNRNGIVNEVQFFYDGYDYWYSISQAVGATAIDATPPTAVSAAVANATPTIVNITMSEAMDPANVPAASAFTVSGHTVSSVAISGSAINLTCSTAFVNGEAARTVAYTQPGTNNARDIAGNLLANFTGLAITNSVGVAATGGTMAGPTTGPVSVASTNFTVGFTPVGSTVTGTVRWTPASTGSGDTFTPAYLDLTTGQSGTFTVTPNATAGARTISITNNGGLTNPSSITYTSTPAASYIRVTPRASLITETGSGPYGYVVDASVSGFANVDGLFTAKLQSGVDGSLAVTNTGNIGFILGMTTASTAQSFGTLLYEVWYQPGGSYGFLSAGGSPGGTAGTSMYCGAGDIVRLRRVGSTVYAEAARASTPTTFVLLYTWTGITTGIIGFGIDCSSGGAFDTITGVGLA